MILSCSYHLSKRTTMGCAVLIIFIISLIRVASQDHDCSPIYVRWPRVRLNLTSRLTGGYTLEECAAACSKDEHPGRPGYPLQCSGFNHKHGASSLTNDCQLFQKDQVANLDGNVEYDDRYSFYWKYCVKTKESCKSVYSYDFHIDRYMDYNESQRRVLTYQVEDCLEQCLNEKSFECRSVSFNRTAGYCYLSGESRLSKPTAVRVNGNPNYRIDYYENKCHNDSFTFHHECQPGGVLVSVDARFPYTGAMYGLYDFFSCRVEPKEETKFQYFFPFSSISKNCSDSMSIRDGEYVLEVVLSTDNVIPLYFLTDEDLIYKVKCPVDHYSASTIGAQVELIPPLSKIEAVSSISPNSTPKFSSTAASSSAASASTFSLSYAPETTTAPTTTENSTESKDLKSTVAFFGQSKKKPEILPSLDAQPSISKSGNSTERHGNKITLFVRYPQNDNESLEVANSSTEAPSTSTDWSNSTGISFVLDSDSSILGNSTNGTSLGNSTLGNWTFDSTLENHTLGNHTLDRQASDNQPLDHQTSDSSTLWVSTTTPTPKTSPTEISTSTDPDTSTTTNSKSLSPTRRTSIKDSNPNADEEDEDLHILPFVFTPETSTPQSSTTSIPSWLYAWRAQLASSKYSTASPSPTPRFYSTKTKKTDPAFNIDSISSFTKSINFDSRFLSTESTTSTKSESTSTQTTTPTSTTEATTTSPFWPFVLRTKQTTETSPSTESTSTPTSTSTSTPTSTSTSTFTSTSASTSTSTSTSSPTSTASESTTTTSSTSAPQNLTNDSNQSNASAPNPTTTASTTVTTSGAPKKILFDIFHNGQPVSAVVVGSRITLSFLPSLSLPGSYMTLVGCQVEPVNSPYAWERDPLQIVKNGCQADGVGLVCPPLYSEAGVKVEMEAFRYTTTGEVLYSCLVRICPYGPCPQPICTEVDGCNGQRRPVAISSPAFLNPTLALGRRKRQAPIPLAFLPISADLQQNLVSLAGDHVINKKLVVVNSESELQYYLRTGNVPSGGNSNGLLLGG